MSTGSLQGAAVIVWASAVPSMRPGAAQADASRHGNDAPNPRNFMGSWDATIAVYEFQKSTNYVLVPLIAEDDEDSIAEELAERIHDNEADRVTIAVRPQPDGDHLSYISVGQRILESGMVPVLIDACNIGANRFLYLAQSRISVDDIKAAMGPDWIDGVHVWLGHGGTPMQADDVHDTWTGMLVTISPRGFGPPLLDNVNALLQHRDDWARDLAFSGLPRDRPRDDRMGFVDWNAACSVSEWPAQHGWTGVKDAMERACGLSAADVLVCSCDRNIPFFSFRGHWVPALYGVFQRQPQSKVRVFLDVRDLGVGVRTVGLEQRPMLLEELLTAARLRLPCLPCGWKVSVNGALHEDAFGRLTFQHRTVLEVKVVSRARELPDRDDSDGRDPPEPGGDDSGDNASSGGGPDEARRSTDRAHDRRSRSPRRPSQGGASAQFGELQHRRLEDDMWKGVFDEHAILDCQPADTSIVLPCLREDLASQSPDVPDSSGFRPELHDDSGFMVGDVETVLGTSPTKSRRCYLDQVWEQLRRMYDVGDDDPTEERHAVLKLDELLSGTDKVSEFRLDHSQCRIPVDDELLQDIQRFVPFHRIQKRPDGLCRSHRFLPWAQNEQVGRPPGPSEMLVVTADGSHLPGTAMAGWGITFAARSHGDPDSDVFLGCLWGSLTSLVDIIYSAMALARWEPTLRRLPVSFGLR